MLQRLGKGNPLGVIAAVVRANGDHEHDAMRGGAAALGRDVARGAVVCPVDGAGRPTAEDRTSGSEVAAGAEGRAENVRVMQRDVDSAKAAFGETGDDAVRPVRD